MYVMHHLKRGREGERGRTNLHKFIGEFLRQHIDLLGLRNKIVIEHFYARKLILSLNKILPTMDYRTCTCVLR